MFRVLNLRLINFNSERHLSFPNLERDILNLLKYQPIEQLTLFSQFILALSSTFPWVDSMFNNSRFEDVQISQGYQESQALQISVSTQVLRFASAFIM